MAIILGTTEWIPIIKLILESAHQVVSNDVLYIIQRSVFIEIQAYQYSDIIGHLSKLVWHLLWQMTTPLGTSFDYIIEIACTQTIIILYKYFYVWRLDFKLNNISFHYLSSIFVFSSLRSILIFIIIVRVVNNRLGFILFSLSLFYFEFLFLFLYLDIGEENKIWHYMSQSQNCDLVVTHQSLSHKSHAHMT